MNQEQTTSINNPRLDTWLRLENRYMRYTPPVFITSLLLVGHFTFGILDSALFIGSAIVTSMVLELVLGKLFYGKWRNLASAYISGISVGILIRSTVLWPYIVTAALSIMSKYLLKYKGRHIWNPSNFGISWMLFTAAYSVAGLSVQWGNNMYPLLVIWGLGLVIVWRAKRVRITLTYVFSFIFFAYIRSLISGDNFFAELAPLTGPMYQLFIFFMITDPATTLKNKKGQVLTAFLIALLEFVLRLNSFIYAPFYALFLIGPVAKIFESYMDDRRAKMKNDLSPAVRSA